MATYTTNYRFEKPEGSDLLKPDPFNDNFDKLDNTLYNLSLTVGETQPWIELANFEDSIDEMSGDSSSGRWSDYYYRNLSDLSNPISYYDRIFLIMQVSVDYNVYGSDSASVRVDPCFSVNGSPLTNGGSLSGWMMQFFGSGNETYSRSSTFRNVSEFTLYNTDVSFVFRNYNGEHIINWNNDVNGFGLNVSRSSHRVTIYGGSLKCKLWGQRTYGDMRL